MDLHLKDKVVLITGGAKGIGAAISEEFAKEGAKLVVNYRSNPKKCLEYIDYLKDKYNIEAIGVCGDVGYEDNVKRIFDEAINHFGKVDVLVNNAGYLNKTAFLDIAYEEWNESLRSNVTAMMLMTKEFALRAIERKQPGRVVNILSKIAVLSKSKNRLCYTSAKCCEMGLTKQIAVDLTEHNIIANGILVGLVKTDLNKDMPGFADKEARTPLKRATKTSEIANNVVYLSSDQCQTMVGSILDASGGLLLGY